MVDKTFTSKEGVGTSKQHITDTEKRDVTVSTHQPSSLTYRGVSDIMTVDREMSFTKSHERDRTFKGFLF